MVHVSHNAEVPHPLLWEIFQRRRLTQRHGGEYWMISVCMVRHMDVHLHTEHRCHTRLSLTEQISQQEWHLCVSDYASSPEP